MSDRASVGESVGESVGQPDQELLEEIIQRRRNVQFPSQIPNLLMSRHSGIAHAVEDGWNLASVRAKSRHSSLRSLEVYANPSAESIAAMTAALDPEARRR